MSDALDSEDPLAVYQREVGKVPTLDAAEEARCVEHVRTSDEMADAARRRLDARKLGRS
jgi:sigma-70-like protein